MKPQLFCQSLFWKFNKLLSLIVGPNKGDQICRRSLFDSTLAFELIGLKPRCCKTAHGLMWTKQKDLGCFSWSGLGSATLWAQNMRSADCLNILTDQTFCFSSSPMAQAYSNMPRLERVSMRNDFHSMGCAGQDFTQRSDSPMINTRPQRNMNATLDAKKMCLHCVWMWAKNQ